MRLERFILNDGSRRIAGHEVHIVRLLNRFQNIIVWLQAERLAEEINQKIQLSERF